MMMQNTLTPRGLLQDWDDQQAAYVAHRELRFEAVLDVLRHHLPPEFTALDLACGPGSLSDRLLSTFPKARVTAVDYDPLLLHLAGSVLADHGNRAGVLEVDLARPHWWTSLPADESYDAVVSSTALHWLSPLELLRVYSDLADLLPAGAVFLNADHLRFGPETPTLREVSQRHDTEFQRAAFARGVHTWTTWYARAAEVPELEALAAERERRFADRPPQPLAPLDFHLAALRTAGFAEVGTAWQYLDDYVVFARR